MKTRSFPVNTWIDEGAIWFECPTCDNRIWPRPKVKCTHSPAKCRECGTKFELVVVAKTLPK